MFTKAATNITTWQSEDSGYLGAGCGKTSTSGFEREGRNAIVPLDPTNRNLADFEKRRSRNPDAEKTVNELEPTIEEQSTVEHGIEPIPDKSIDDVSRQGVEQDKDRGSGLSEIPEEDSSEIRRKTPQTRNERNSRRNINRGFDLDL